MTSVDLIINCYEKTQKKVLDKESIHNVLKQNKYKFKNIFILINNVKDKNAVIDKASKLKTQKIINDYFFVEDYIDKVLKVVKLRKEDLEPIPHYTDWALVAAYVCKSEYLLHWDPDIYLEKPIDWITQSLNELKKNINFFCASPLWKQEENVIRRECYKENSIFIYNDDFSDQIFLVKKENILKPIYKYWHIYSLRFPLAYLGSTFERRIDSFVKETNRTRLIFKKAIYIHPQESGTPYPKKIFLQKIKHYWYMIIIVLYYYWFYPYRNIRIKLYRNRE